MYCMKMRALVVAVVMVSATVLMLFLLARPKEVRQVRRRGAQRYRALDNYGMGYCLFNCFVQASESRGRATSVPALRAAVARGMDQERLVVLKQIYKESQGDLDMMRDYSWMRGVETLQDLRERVMTPSYYGDDMALPLLERATGLDAVVVSRGSEQKRMDDRVGAGAWVVLLLKNVHYTLMQRNGRSVFDEYPRDVIEAARRLN